MKWGVRDEFRGQGEKIVPFLSGNRTDVCKATDKCQKWFASQRKALEFSWIAFTPQRTICVRKFSFDVPKPSTRGRSPPST